MFTINQDDDENNCCKTLESKPLWLRLLTKALCNFCLRQCFCNDWQAQWNGQELKWEGGSLLDKPFGRASGDLWCKCFFLCDSPGFLRNFLAFWNACEDECWGASLFSQGCRFLATKAQAFPINTFTHNHLPGINNCLKDNWFGYKMRTPKSFPFC